MPLKTPVVVAPFSTSCAVVADAYKGKGASTRSSSARLRRDVLLEFVREPDAH